MIAYLLLTGSVLSISVLRTGKKPGDILTGSNCSIGITGFEATWSMYVARFSMYASENTKFKSLYTVFDVISTLLQ